MNRVQGPTYEGSVLGEMLSRFVNEEVRRNPALRRRCHDCAFREGTRPNSMPGTLMDALKCVIEKTPFYCHLIAEGGKQPLCAGWEALIERKALAGDAPWPFFTTDDVAGRSEATITGDAVSAKVEDRSEGIDP